MGFGFLYESELEEGGAQEYVPDAMDEEEGDDQEGIRLGGSEPEEELDYDPEEIGYEERCQLDGSAYRGFHPQDTDAESDLKYSECEYGDLDGNESTVVDEDEGNVQAGEFEGSGGGVVDLGGQASFPESTATMVAVLATTGGTRSLPLVPQSRAPHKSRLGASVRRQRRVRRIAQVTLPEKRL